LGIRINKSAFVVGDFLNFISFLIVYRLPVQLQPGSFASESSESSTKIHKKHFLKLAKLSKALKPSKFFKKSKSF
jgi:hypothetical protein